MADGNRSERPARQKRVAVPGLLAAVLVLAGTTGGAGQEGPAEAAMDGYVRCIEDAADRLKDSCEPAMVVVTATMASCMPARRAVEMAILPFHRFYEEMIVTMAGIDQAQRDRLLARLVAYRIGRRCPTD
ncbi:hypothetical protein [Prosthecomicrobium sp. N25]|uniref:hypothetical protein n=1 Tax=Prosthecomicrobium sp. N25 TaxID=3129254 RepID=UPI0030784EE1